MTRLVLLLALLFSLSCGEQPPTPAQFTQEFVEEVRKTRPSLVATVEADLQVRIETPDGAHSTTFLENAYQLALQDPEARGAVIRGYVQAILEPKSTVEPVDRTRIVPVVKDRAWLSDIGAALAARGAEKPLEQVHEDLNEDLVVVYAVDDPKSIRYLTPEDLTTIGVQREELRALALDNLRRILPMIEISAGPLFSMISAGGDYDASLLLLDEIWTGGSIHVDGDIVVAVPSRDVLLVSGSRNAEGIAKMRELAAKNVQDSPYRLTATLFVYRNGGFTRFEGQDGR